ncbi:hypothetical protein [Aliiroseovarius sp. YM-037]|uniref:hypothetical protein n=1 Tax=Aliiroseovarius sp. YM-037 TaxID=3341728 RepID=UPI003A80B7B5
MKTTLNEDERGWSKRLAIRLELAEAYAMPNRDPFNPPTNAIEQLPEGEKFNARIELAKRFVGEIEFHADPEFSILIAELKLTDLVEPKDPTTGLKPQPTS